MHLDVLGDSFLRQLEHALDASKSDPLAAVRAGATMLLHAISYLEMAARIQRIRHMVEEEAAEMRIRMAVEGIVPALSPAIFLCRPLFTPAVLRQLSTLHEHAVKAGDSTAESHTELVLKSSRSWLLDIVAGSSYLIDDDPIVIEFVTEEEVVSVDPSKVLPYWPQIVARRAGICDPSEMRINVGKELDQLGKLPPILNLHVHGNAITFNGVTYSVEPHLAKWIARLVEAREKGEKISGEELTALAGRGKHVRREFKKLQGIPSLYELFDSKSGSGGGWYLKG